MSITKELWWILWGIGLAFAVQVLYDIIGVYYPNEKSVFGIIITAIILIGLALTGYRLKSNSLPKVNETKKGTDAQISTDEIKLMTKVLRY